MRCRKCGAELSDDAKFCSYCGHKFEQEDPVAPPHPITNNDTPAEELHYSDEVGSATSQKATNKFVEKAKGKFLVFWKGLDTFSKISSIIIAIAALLLLIAMIAGKAFAICISVLQISGVIVALLMHKGKIKLDEKQKFVKPLILCLAILFTLLNVWSFSWGTDDGSGNPSHVIPNISAEAQSEILSPFGASDCKGQDYTNLESKFYAAGFTHIKTEPIEDLTSGEEDKLNTVESISINNTTEFTKDQKFDENAEVLIQYHTYQKCAVTLSVDFIPNLIFSKYDVIMEVDGDEEGTLPHGEDKSFDLQLAPGEHTFSFVSADSSSVSGEAIVAIKGTADVELKISCTSDAIDVEIVYVEDMGSVGADEAMITEELITNKNSNYETVSQILTSAGFTNITLQPQYDVSPDSEDIGKTIEVIIDGNSDYERGSVFAKNVDVVITYHMKEEDDPNKPTNVAEAPDDWTNLIENHYEEVKKQFLDAGFTNITCVAHEIDFDEDKVFEGSVVNIAIGENGEICTFAKGEQWDKNIKIRIDYRVKPAKPDTTKIVLPQNDSKLGKDLDTKGTSTVYYINTDNISNKPSTTQWGSATVTDGVAEYLDYLKDLGFTVTVTDATHKEPYSGYHTYETNFKVSNDSISWTMYLYIQKEQYVEYELDVYLN